ncbi:MAG: hypothetical protein LAN84_16955 [Acidobacteriia bacterium]|nr:hypothetical protein [Terriglobia bacterium]
MSRSRALRGLFSRRRNALLCPLLLLCAAAHPAAATPSSRNDASSQPGIPFITDGGVPGGPCLRLQGVLMAGDFFAGLKRKDGPDGTEYRRGGARVTRYPGELQLNFQVRDFPCPENIASGGPRQYLTREWINGLRIGFYWKRGLQTRAINDVRDKTVSVERIEPLDALDAQSLPERFVWKFRCVVPGDGVSLAEHLVIIVRAPGGRIVARVAARF